MHQYLPFLYLIIVFNIFNVDTVYSKSKFNNRKGTESHSGYILKSDLIPAFNSILEKSSTQFNFGLEACFKKCYSIQGNFNYDRYKTKNESSRSYEPGIELRWYIESGEMHFFHFGLFTFYKFSESFLVKEWPDTKLKHYKENLLENGIAGGFRLICIGKLEMDISTYIGYSMQTYYHAARNENFYAADRKPEVSTRITFAAAYHF
ncbi:MAG TPA: DUF3575 domain-containing protein [Bacteroidia bacterium]|nr:DUF3575 domain-containing protein [Bacteroidia bacterium]